eukprot:3489161-Pyramimonas_sp.AAC.3
MYNVGLGVEVRFRCAYKSFTARVPRCSPYHSPPTVECCSPWEVRRAIAHLFDGVDRFVGKTTFVHSILAPSECHPAQPVSPCSPIGQEDPAKAVLYHWFAAESKSPTSQMALGYYWYRQGQCQRALPLYQKVADVTIAFLSMPGRAPLVEQVRPTFYLQLSRYTSVWSKSAAVCNS